MAILTRSYSMILLSPEKGRPFINVNCRTWRPENTICDILFFEERPIDLSLPFFVDLKIVEADPWAKGDTAAGSTKPVTLETGYVLQVPPFVEEGQMIRIDTRTGAYVERVKS